MSDLRSETLETNEIVWEEPPDPMSKYQSRLDAMKADPYKSLLWDNAAKSTGSAAAKLKARGFITKSAPNRNGSGPEGTYRIYVKYVGPANVDKGWSWQPTAAEIALIREAASNGQPFVATTIGNGKTRRSDVTSPRTRRTFSPEFKAEIVKRVRAGEKLVDISTEHNIWRSNIEKWVREAKRPAKRVRKQA